MDREGAVAGSLKVKPESTDLGVSYSSPVSPQVALHPHLSLDGAWLPLAARPSRVLRQPSLSVLWLQLSQFLTVITTLP